MKKRKLTFVKRLDWEMSPFDASNIILFLGVYVEGRSAKQSVRFRVSKVLHAAKHVYKLPEHVHKHDERDKQHRA